DVAPELAPRLGLDARGEDLHEAFFGGRNLFPVAEDEEERLVDVVLAEGVAEADGRAEFGGLRGGGQAGERGHGQAVFFGGDVPFLGVSGGSIRIEEGVEHPALEDEAVGLDLLRDGGGDAEPGEGGEGDELAEKAERARHGRGGRATKGWRSRAAR